MKRTILTLLSALLIACMLIPAAIAEEIAVEPLDAPVAVEEAVIGEDAELPTEDAEPDAEIGNDAQQYESAEVVNPSYDAAMEPLYASGNYVAINEANFPDPNFRAYLSKEFDDDGDDLVDVQYVRSITLVEHQYTETGVFETFGYGVTSLEGIKLFTELESLVAHHNPIASVDLSNMPKLNNVTIGGSEDQEQLTSVNVSGCTSLEFLQCSYSPNLKSLDVTGCSSLGKIDCAY